MPRGLADLFISSGGGVQFRVGKVVSWSSVTGENEIIVSGSTLVDVPVVNNGTLPTLAEDDGVALLSTRNGFILLGKLEQPPI